MSVNDKVTVDGIAGRSRNVGNHGAVFVQQAVEERTLASIRAAENSKTHRAFFAAFATHRRREHGDHFVQEREASVAGQGTDRTRLAKAKLQKFVAFLAVALQFALVRDEDDLLVELADEARKLLVELGDAHADIDHEEHEVGFVHGVKNLGADAVRQDVDRIIGQESTRIDDCKFVTLVNRILVMTVAGNTIAVAHHGGTAAKNAVEEGGLSDVRTSNYANDR